ncbi:ferredoxin [Peterkaempfera bronchialis]|uniref:ferredoxin n=1 Tax=Peterkaempfera bronchialis TaxID=2126346 RepID=UPI003C2B3620
MLITADRDRCIGAGLCVLTAPEVFEHDDDGLVHVLEQEPDARLEKDLRLAQQLCPAHALALDTAAPHST